MSESRKMFRVGNNEQQSSGTDWLVMAIVVAVLLLGGGWFAAQRMASNPSTPSPTHQAVIVVPTQPRSKAPGMVTDVVTAKELNAIGSTSNPEVTFSQTDPAIYLVVSLNNATTGKMIEYTRYLDGTLVDNGSTTIDQDGVKNVSFAWKLKTPGATHPPGKYVVKVYTDGVFEMSTSYTVN